MERLSASPFVMNVYGYCGQSALNELADFIDGYSNLQVFARSLQDRFEPHITVMKLQLSVMLALGVSHVHGIDGDPSNATLIHYDINPKNVAIVQGGRPKLNDFNVAEFVRWNTRTGERCGFRGRLHEPWWRAPEEMIMVRSEKGSEVHQEEGGEGTLPINDESGGDGYVDSVDDMPILTEKIDVYSLGNLLHNTLTGHSPRGQTRKWRAAEVRESVLNGNMPNISVSYANSSDPSIIAILRAMQRCFEKRPEDRWSAKDIADEMLDTLGKVKISLAASSLK